MTYKRRLGRFIWQMNFGWIVYILLRYQPTNRRLIVIPADTHPPFNISDTTATKILPSNIVQCFPPAATRTKREGNVTYPPVQRIAGIIMKLYPFA